MHNRHNRSGGSPAGQMLVGLVVIAFGMLFLLDNLGIMEFDFVFRLWPVLFILAGALRLSQGTSDGSRVGGVVLIGVGLLLLLKGLGLIYVSWRMLAPLLMIGAGLLVVFKSAHGHGAVEASLPGRDDAGAGHDSIVRITALLGGIDRRVTTSDFRGGEVTAIMGGCKLDLRHASIQGDAVLTVFALWGGIEVKVPDDWTISLEGTPLLGGFNDRTSAPAGSALDKVAVSMTGGAVDNVPCGGKRLVIRGVALMGGVDVRN